MSDRGAVAITCANGYVGGALGAAFVAPGYSVIALQRFVPTGVEARDHISYSLEDGPGLRCPVTSQRSSTARMTCAPGPRSSGSTSAAPRS
jgi:nucleoside-diphosphate-sugar epimerase